MKAFRFILFIFFSFFFKSVSAQLNTALPLDTFPLHSLSQFNGAGKSWSITGAVMADRNSSKIKLKPGKGVLAYQPDAKQSQSRIAAFSHGNMDFEIQFLLAKQSEAAILFQGLYAIHLKDSWGEKNARYSDCGGISIANPSSSTPITRIAPLYNAAHAPGLWQKLRVSFKAPEFNSKGEKIKNARFSKVILNGLTIHENIELPLAGGITEKAEAPLVLAGIKGPVAFRNIAYLPVKDEQVKLRDITFNYFEVKLDSFPDFTIQKIAKKGILDALSWEPAANNDGFAFEYSGTMDIPSTNLYHFQLVTLGGGQLSIDGQQVIEHIGRIDHEGKMSRKDLGEATIKLEKGKHPFRLIYFKNTWAPIPILGLFVQGRGAYRQALNADNSYSDEDPVSRIVVKPMGEPVMQRSFLRYKGNRKTYCISVGDPTGVHYSYDLSNGSLLHAWKGPFADATGIWHERGSQLLEVSGSPLLFNDQPQFAPLKHASSWPEKLPQEKDYYQLKGYTLDANGRPVFQYRIAGLGVKDAVYPEEDGKILTRKLVINSSGAAGDLYFRALLAKEIAQFSESEYIINDGEYIIRFNTPVRPQVREAKEGKELLVSVKKGSDTTEINYSIIW